MKYAELVDVYQQLEKTSKRLEKTSYLSEFLKKVQPKDIEKIVLLSQGKVFPDWDERKIGVAIRIVIKALNQATGVDNDLIEKEWAKTGDMGTVAENLISRKRQSTLFSEELSIDKVFNNLRKLAELEGHGSVDNKVALISELLTSAKPSEAKYILRTILTELRIGLGEGAIRDSIVWAYFGEDIGIKYDKKENEMVLPDDNREKYQKYADAVQEAYDLANDYAVVAKLAKEKGLKGLENVELEAGKPIKVMLFQKAENIPEAFESLGKPAEFEYKYDGFRIQAHKFDNKIVLYTRRLENVTKQFPDVAEYIKEHVKGDSFIIDSEAVGYDPKTKKYLAFQSISQRIKRKYDIEELAKKFPVELNVFDVVFYNGKSLIKTPFSERRKLIEKIVSNPTKLKIKPADNIVTDSVDEANSFYQRSLSAGNEGIMGKNLQGIYKPGSRVGFGMKIKPILDTLDLVIVGAERGEGKRSEWLSSFILACRDEDTGEYLEIGRVSTGLKEKTEEGTSFEQMTELLTPLITEDKGKYVAVKPEIVIEIAFEEIQASPGYGSGFALRFPRFVKLREDRRADEISTLEDVKNIYENQRGRKS